MRPESKRKGPLRKLFGGLWWLLDGTRRLVFNLVFLALLAALLYAWFGGGPPALQERTVLVLDLEGPIVEQQAGDARGTALAQLQGDDTSQIQLRDLLAVIDTAAKDPKIERLLLVLEGLAGGGLATQREVAAALERFKASGKQVVAWGTAYDQRQFYLAAHAHEVWLHPMGAIEVTGYGRQRTYWADAFEKAGVKANVIRAGRYKNAGETFSANAPSPETLESDAFVYDALWALYTGGVERARRLPEGSVMQLVDGLPGNLVATGGDLAKLLLESKFVDGLKTQDELRQLLIERGVADDRSKSFRQIGWRAYLARMAPRPPAGDTVGVIVAEGEIGDGEAPPGRIGGRSTAQLIRSAREDAHVKALVLRVNSPGGSALGSELVRRELELTRGAGKPVVVSMGDVAASGGYWISMAADQVIADPATITGSIGVIALLPTAEGLTERLGLRAGGHTTTWLGKAHDLRTGIDPRFSQVIQSLIDQAYVEFTSRAAKARGTTREKIDEVAQGRVWTGTQALERGLIDRTGSYADALQAARQLAKLGEDTRERYLERDRGRLQQLLSMMDARLLAPVGEALGLPDLARLGSRWAPGVPAELLQAWQRDADWLAQMAAGQRPHAPVVHCLCGP